MILNMIMTLSCKQTWFIYGLRCCNNVHLFQFYCDETAGTSMVSVDEPATCMYSISVHSKELCAHPLFKPLKKEKAREITCSPALTEEQYNDYTHKEQGDICIWFYLQLPRLKYWPMLCGLWKFYLLSANIQWSAIPLLVQGSRACTPHK